MTTQQKLREEQQKITTPDQKKLKHNKDLRKIRIFAAWGELTKNKK